MAPIDAKDVYEHVLAWKGTVFMNQSGSRGFRSAPQIRRLFDDLQSVSARLSTLALKRPNPKGREIWQRQLMELSDRKESLEGELASKSDEFRRQKALSERGIDALRQSLPANVVLIDFLEYTRSRPGSRPSGNNERCLVVFVVRQDRPISRVELGPVQTLAAAAGNWRGAIEQGIQKSQAQLAERPQATLRKKLWEPIEPSLAGSEIVLVSTDGFLNQVPLGALPGRKPNKYLLEETKLVQIAVPRQLSVLLAEHPTGRTANLPTSLLLVGNVDFRAASGVRSVEPFGSETPVTGRRRAARGSETGLFSPLPGTAREIDKIRSLCEKFFPNSQPRLLQGSEATEAAFCNEAPNHRYLHLATHGFFAHSDVKSALEASDSDSTRPGLALGTVSKDSIQGFHPGLLSGVVLAGANDRECPRRIEGRQSDRN